MSHRPTCDICNGPSPLTGVRCDRCLSWIETGGLIHYTGDPAPKPTWL